MKNIEGLKSKKGGRGGERAGERAASDDAQ